MGLDDAVLQKFLTNGVDTMASLALSRAYTPGSSDDKPFLDMVKTINGGTPP